MTVDHISTEFFEAVNNRNLNQMGDLLTEEAVFYFPKTQPLLGKDRIQRFFKILFRQYPKLSFEVKMKIIDGNKSAVHWVNKGVSRKDEPYENEGVTILEEHGEKINFISDFFKDTGKF